MTSNKKHCVELKTKLSSPGGRLPQLLQGHRSHHYGKENLGLMLIRTIIKYKTERFKNILLVYDINSYNSILA
jgi:hypothetical protein